MAKSQKKCLPAEVLARVIEYATSAGDGEAVEFLSNIKTCRKPSAYNIHIGECMGKGKSMSACAEEYRRKKK